MNNSIYLILFLVLLKFKSFESTEIGVCHKKGDSNKPVQVCCADFEEKHGKCIPCTTGYTSEIGQMCQPCPQNKFGSVCTEICECSEFQRCDNIVGCVEIGTSETYTETNQKTKVNQNAFTTASLVFTSSNIETTVFATEDLLLSERMIYYSVSSGLLILINFLSVVIFKYKRKHKRRIVQIVNPERVSTSIENDDQEEIEDTHSYEEIDDAGINVRPENWTVNAFPEVVSESDSSTSRNGDDHERNSYLNPYQPFVTKDDKELSYEKLQLQPIIGVCNIDKSNVDVLDKNISETSNQSAIFTSYDNQQYYFGTKMKLSQQCVTEIQKYSELNCCTSRKSVKLLNSVSNCDLRKERSSNTRTLEKYLTL